MHHYFKNYKKPKKKVVDMKTQLDWMQSSKVSQVYSWSCISRLQMSSLTQNTTDRNSRLQTSSLIFSTTGHDQRLQIYDVTFLCTSHCNYGLQISDMTLCITGRHRGPICENCLNIKNKRLHNKQHKQRDILIYHLLKLSFTCNLTLCLVY